MKPPLHSSQNRGLLFVYGSLQRGYELHAYLQHQHFCGPATTSPNYRLFDCGAYPALVYDQAGGHSICGEVYQVTTKCLTRIDIVEGVDEGLYSRELIALATPTALQTQAVYAYLYCLSTASLPDCGSHWP